jgi:hypothetical protein
VLCPDRDMRISAKILVVDDSDDLAPKVLKPLKPYEKVKESATSEMQKLFLLVSVS